MSVTLTPAGRLKHQARARQREGGVQHHVLFERVRAHETLEFHADDVRNIGHHQDGVGGECRRIIAEGGEGHAACAERASQALHDDSPIEPEADTNRPDGIRIACIQQRAAQEQVHGNGGRIAAGACHHEGHIELAHGAHETGAAKAGVSGIGPGGEAIGSGACRDLPDAGEALDRECLLHRAGAADVEAGAPDAAAGAAVAKGAVCPERGRAGGLRFRYARTGEDCHNHGQKKPSGRHVRLSCLAS